MKGRRRQAAARSSAQNGRVANVAQEREVHRGQRFAGADSDRWIHRHFLARAIGKAEAHVTVRDVTAVPGNEVKAAIAIQGERIRSRPGSSGREIIPRVGGTESDRMEDFVKGDRIKVVLGRGDRRGVVEMPETIESRGGIENAVVVGVVIKPQTASQRAKANAVGRAADVAAERAHDWAIETAAFTGHDCIGVGPGGIHRGLMLPGRAADPNVKVGAARAANAEGITAKHPHAGVDRDAIRCQGEVLDGNVRVGDGIPISHCPVEGGGRAATAAREGIGIHRAK